MGTMHLHQCLFGASVGSAIRQWIAMFSRSSGGGPWLMHSICSGFCHIRRTNLSTQSYIDRIRPCTIVLHVNWKLRHLFLFKSPNTNNVGISQITSTRHCSVFLVSTVWCDIQMHRLLSYLIHQWIHWCSPVKIAVSSVTLDVHEPAFDTTNLLFKYYDELKCYLHVLKT